METPFRIRRLIHRDQSCSFEIWRAICSVACGKLVSVHWHSEAKAFPPQSTDRQIEANKNNREALIQHVEVMNLLVKLFYDLSSQDLPPIFEDNLGDVTALLHKYLTYENPLLATD